MVEGIYPRQTGFGQRLDNHVRFPGDVSGRNPDRCNASGPKPLIADIVTLRPSGHVVGDAIHFDGNCGLRAEKVEDVRPSGVLASKLEAPGP